MTTKVSKRMEANKVRGAYNDAPKKLLLPVSLGVSSIALLHVLDQHIHAQLEKSGRPSFALHVLFIDQSAFVRQTTYHNAFAGLKQRFPLHTFSVAMLDEVLECDVLQAEEIFQSNISSAEDSALSRPDKLSAMLSGLPSTTSRLDIITILRRRLIIAFAQSHDCSSLVLGDSTTRLAERTLSETAKGRGAFLPWLTADSTSLTGLKIYYPMRDLLKRELILYVGATDPPLETFVLDAECENNAPVSSKDTTIDGLMSQYFESVEQNYPSIVANVVRTSGRLAAPDPSHDSLACGMCGLLVKPASEAWAGNQGSLPASSDRRYNMSDGSEVLCYGCTRSVATA